MKETGNKILEAIFENCSENAETLKAIIVAVVLITGWVFWAECCFKGMPIIMVQGMCALIIYPTILAVSVIGYKIIRHFEKESERNMNEGK